MFEPRYVGGRCPICGGFTSLVFCRRNIDNQMFLYCFECECCWEKVGASYVSSDAVPEKSYAPSGFDVATLDQIRSADLEKYIIGTEDL